MRFGDTAGTHSESQRDSYGRASTIERRGVANVRLAKPFWLSSSFDGKPSSFVFSVRLPFSDYIRLYSDITRVASWNLTKQRRHNRGENIIHTAGEARLSLKPRLLNCYRRKFEKKKNVSNALRAVARQNFNFTFPPVGIQR